GPQGWVVDLRGNIGGDMWPMLAGIGPILGEGGVGAFVGKGDKRKWVYRDGRALEGEKVEMRATAPYQLKQADPPVAVLTDGQTAARARPSPLPSGAGPRRGASVSRRRAFRRRTRTSG